jgi:RNA recognition motif-containing protein
MPSKLYVGNLAYAVTNEDLVELFSQAGKVESAVVISDKFSGQSRGFGFVEMADDEGAQKAVATLNEAELKGRRIRIDQARATERRSDSRGPGGGGGDRGRGRGPGGGGGGGGGRRSPRW